MCEFHYVVTSVWRSQVLGLFVFMFININMLICIISLISVLNTYLSLRAGDWAWWWRSFHQGFWVGLWAFTYMMYMAEVEF